MKSKILYSLPLIPYINLLGLILFFGWGYTATRELSSFDGASYSLLTVLGIISSAMLTYEARKSEYLNLPFWVVFALFMFTFFFKFYFIVLYPESVLAVPGHVTDMLYAILHEPVVLNRGFTTATLGFAAFCLTGWVLMRKCPLGRSNTRSTSADSQNLVIRYLQIALPALLILLGMTLYLTGVGVMGQKSIQLPFRMAGWIYYVWSIFLPTVMLVFLLFSDNLSKTWHFLFGIGLFVLHGFSDMLIRSSRGTLMRTFILLFFLFLVSRKINLKRVLLVAAIALITVFSYPVLTEYRHFRSAQPTAPLGQALNVSLERTWTGKAAYPLKTLSLSFNRLFMRFTGVENVLIIAKESPAPLYKQTFKVSPISFYTFNILGFGPESSHRSVPTMVGWLYLAGGNVLVVVGISLLTILPWFVWKYLYISKLYISEIAKAYFLYWLLWLFITGFPERPYILLFVVVGSLFVCELMLRGVHRRTIQNTNIE